MAVESLGRTLDSLYSQTAVQSGRCQLEHLVIDGGSNDGTEELVARYPSAFSAAKDRGMYNALAKGLGRAQGDVVGYLNAGDIVFPWAFEVLVEIFSRGNIDWLTGYSTQINSRGQVTACWKPPRYRREFVLNGFYSDDGFPQAIQQESTFWSRKANGSVDLNALSEFRLAGDYFVWTQLASKFDLHSVMSPLGAFCVHQGQLSENKSGYFAETRKCVRAPTARENFTAWWETECNPVLKSRLWKFTLGQSPARIFEYLHNGGYWEPR